MNTTAFPVLDQAHTALRTVINAVTPDQWNLPTPCAQWNVTQVLQHAAGDQHGFAAAITGTGWPTEDPFAPSGTLTTPATTLTDNAIRAAAAAWATIDPATTEVAVPVPPGQLSATTGAGACALDAAVHAWDIAIATGQPNPLTPDLASELLVVAHQIVEPLRGYGAYAPALAPQPHNPVTDLLHYLGRRADRTA